MKSPHPGSGFSFNSALRRGRGKKVGGVRAHVQHDKRGEREEGGEKIFVRTGGEGLTILTTSSKKKTRG